MLSITLRSATLLVLLAFAPVSHAAFHLFRIEQIFSNADGTVQFVVLKECCNTNGENLWDGQLLRATANGQTKTFQFPTNLPGGGTANKRVLVASEGFAQLGLITPDYVIPNGFIPVGGGMLSYAGVSQVTFGPLPTDGVTSISVTGATMPNLATNFAGQTASVKPGAALPTAAAIEFYNASLDHYFITDRPDEAAVLDAGDRIKGWTRTGQSFAVYTAAGDPTSPVCRFYIPPEKGDSHFYGRGTAECNATAQANPSFVNEDAQFFHVVLPAAGVCPSGTVEVYRVFSNRADANHRYMIDRALRDEMVSQKHWLAEGDGPDLVVMCVPPLPAASAPAPEPTDPTPISGYGP